MQKNNDYTTWTLETLQAEEKKIKQNSTVAAVIIGLCFGILLYSIIKNGFKLIPILLPLGLLFLMAMNSKKTKETLKQIQAEIEKRYNY
jgi:hypothetical protein